MTTGPLYPNDQPGEKYQVGYLPKAREEAMKFLTPIQYAYAARVAQRLGRWDDAEEMSLLRIEAVDTFHELKLKGNVLGKINLRLFFGLFGSPLNKVIVLGAYKKEEEGDLPKHVVITMRNRRKLVQDMLSKEHVTTRKE